MLHRHLLFCPSSSYSDYLLDTFICPTISIDNAVITWTLCHTYIFILLLFSCLFIMNFRRCLAFCWKYNKKIYHNYLISNLIFDKCSIVNPLGYLKYSLLSASGLVLIDTWLLRPENFNTWVCVRVE